MLETVEAEVMSEEVRGLDRRREVGEPGGADWESVSGVESAGEVGGEGDSRGEGGSSAGEAMVGGLRIELS